MGMQKLADLQIFRALFALVRDHVIRDLVAFAEVVQPSLFHGRNMDEHVLAAAVYLSPPAALPLRMPAA